MSQDPVRRIVDAVLYEGYILYPYRPAIKNRQRWTFGGLYPPAYCQGQTGADRSSNQTECLLRGGPETTVAVEVCFLHLTDRQAGEIVPPLAQWPDDSEPSFRPVEALPIGNKVYYSWQEAQERAIILGQCNLGELLPAPARQEFSFASQRWLEPLAGPAGQIEGILVRRQQGMEGHIEAAATRVGEELFRLTVRVVNGTPVAEGEPMSRDEALLRSLVSAHTIIRAAGGELVSLLDPPASCRELAAACCNIGVWPVLVGDEGQKDTLLSSPIILYDYPQVAAESPGDFFDATEIDEMLTLRIMTLTEEEKRAMAAVDERAGELLARTEAKAREHLLGLHGTVRSLRPL